MNAGAAAGGAAAAAAIANAIKASGVLVKVTPEDLLGIISRIEEPLVVIARPSFFSWGNKYLVSYKGLAFHAVSKEELSLPADAEIVEAESLSIPG